MTDHHGNGIFTDPWMVDVYGFHVGITSPMDAKRIRNEPMLRSNSTKIVFKPLR